MRLPLKYAWVAATLFAVVPLAVAQEVAVASEPDGDYLLELTREWSGLASIGDLRSKVLGDKDIELRVWGGYGLGGTHAAILRQVGGEWEAERVRIVKYTAAATDSFAATEGVLPPCILEAMSSRCKTSGPGRVMGSGPTAGQVMGLIYGMDCPHVQRASTPSRQETYAELWEVMVEDGVLMLPPEIKREWIMFDGHSYVIEVRVGDTYRATSIAHATPEVEADHQVQAIARRLGGIAPIYPYWEREESDEE